MGNRVGIGAPRVDVARELFTDSAYGVGLTPEQVDGALAIRDHLAAVGTLADNHAAIQARAGLPLDRRTRRAIRSLFATDGRSLLLASPGVPTVGELLSAARRISVTARWSRPRHNSTTASEVDATDMQADLFGSFAPPTASRPIDQADYLGRDLAPELPGVVDEAPGWVDEAPGLVDEVPGVVDDYPPSYWQPEPEPEPIAQAEQPAPQPVAPSPKSKAQLREEARQIARQAKEQEKAAKAQAKLDARRQREGSLSDDFNALWQAYPALYRGSKPECLKMYKQKVVAEGNSPAEILAGVANYLALKRAKSRDDFVERPRDLVRYLRHHLWTVEAPAADGSDGGEPVPVDNRRRVDRRYFTTQHNTNWTERDIANLPEPDDYYSPEYSAWYKAQAGFMPSLPRNCVATDDVAPAK